MNDQPVTYKGKTYPSQAALARELGLNPATITWHLVTHGNLDRLGKGCGLNAAKPVSYKGVNYPSLAAMGRALGVTPGKAKRMLK